MPNSQFILVRESDFPHVKDEKKQYFCFYIAGIKFLLKNVRSKYAKKIKL